MAVGAVLLLAIGVLAYHFVGTGFLPEIDEGAFVLDYFTPGGTALAETDRQIHIAERILLGMPEVSGISRRTGAELGLFATEQNTGDIVARLTPSGERERSSQEVIDDARTKIESAAPRMRIEFVQILSDVINDLAGAARPVEIKLFGSDLDALERYARQLEPKLSKVDGLEDFFNGVSERSPELMMAINGAEANRVGLTPEQVAGAVSGALLGAPAGEVRLQDRSIGVRVRAPDAVRGDALRLGALPVVIPTSRTTAPLSALATFTATESRATYTRENQQQMITMTSDVSGRSLGAVMADVRSILACVAPAERDPHRARGPVRRPAVRVPVDARRAGARRGGRRRGDGASVQVVRRAARRARRRAALFRRRGGAAARHRHAAQRLVVHGTDPARRPDREERDHPARLHASPDAHQPARRSSPRCWRRGVCGCGRS
jgi:multidrug efflux pump subunit AcrB